jgi:hypothetical protein
MRLVEFPPPVRYKSPRFELNLAAVHWKVPCGSLDRFQKRQIQHPKINHPIESNIG